ncbi:MAG: hypothetical protein KDA51_15795, partial [Planctomycetales bacterium]|nr:hypothetical protein [Planctomycetales bacterium]
MAKATPPTVELDELTALFYESQEDLGTFVAVPPETCPAPYRAILAHQSHMTVAVEKRHGCSVDVEVLEARTSGPHYLRKILLRRQSDQRVVQFGIVRLATLALQPQVRDEILAQRIPLGRVLIDHNVMRQVQLSGIWQVTCGPELAALFSCPQGHRCFGRTALIYCD